MSTFKKPYTDKIKQINSHASPLSTGTSLNIQNQKFQILKELLQNYDSLAFTVSNKPSKRSCR